MRTVWMEAVWSSDLKPMERFVACVYFDHARDQHHAWVTAARLTERTGLSRDAALRARKGLVEAGWIVVREGAGGLLAAPQLPVGESAGAEACAA